MELKEMNLSHTIPATGFIRLRDVQTVVPFSRSTIWRKVASGDFPKPVKLSERVTAWRGQDIIDWLDKVGAAQ